MSESRALLAVREKCSSCEKTSGLPPKSAAGRPELQSSESASRSGGNKAILRVVLLVLAGLSFGASVAPSLAGQSDKASTSAKSGERFFIISSVDITKKQLLLKEPTEITEVLQVNDKTRYTDKNGKAMQFADLRAGDTVFIRSSASSAGKVATSIRKGPMTLEELHQRYLK